jgi:DNA (cytosine-5)-methyltransferase 1
VRTHVDLFSGIGGFALAARWAGVETIAFAEIDPYASRVIKRHFPGVRNYGDVRDVPAIKGVWLATGGVPCQPASVAGKRLGTADDRWLWPEALAAVERIRPTWVLFENPTGILSLNNGVEFECICLALEGQGYEVQPITIPASGVGARHRRNRVWILAHVDKPGFQERFLHAGVQGNQGRNDNGKDLALGRGWACEPAVGRVANGVSARVDRIRCLGNAIVPQVAYQLIKRMIKADGR